ncbi:MAG TPA: GspMb/PilO family protein [Terracidiphilus sp.]|nr:GspMb/PilO family protein [Terracidiphilus sp.]
MSERKPITMRERLRSPLTWHMAGFGVLLALVIVLAVRFAFDWSATSESSTDQLHNRQVQLRVLEQQMKPLRGLDQRVSDSRKQIDQFFDDRIPEHYSSIAEAIGDLQQKSGVNVTRLQYAQHEPGANLTEISIDAGIGGAYPQIMKFVNGLERDKTFFVIRSMSLTGQQGGMVNLRMNFSTWLRPSEVPAGMRMVDEKKSSTSAQEGE